MFANRYFKINQSIPEDLFGIYQAEIDAINSGEGEYPIVQEEFNTINDIPNLEGTLCTSGIGHLYCGVNNDNV